MHRMPARRALLPALLLALALPAGAPAQEVFTLDDLLRLGRERNPTVQALRAEARAQVAERRDAGRLPNPEVEYGRGTGEPHQGGAGRTVEGYAVRQSLENPFRRHYRLGALDALAEAAREDVRTGTLEVEHEVRLHYFRILYLERLAELSRLNEEALAGIRELMENRARVGEVKELEAIRLRVEHMRAVNEAEAAVMELDQYRRHLNTFLGNVLPEGFVLAGELRADAPEPALPDLVARALPGHPALLRATREVEAARHAMKGSRLGWLPDPVLSGSTERALDGDIRRLGVGISIPLWNQSRAALERDRQRVLAAERSQEALRMELEAQILIHLNHLRVNRRTLQLFQEGLLEEAEASMEIADTSYREGEISLVEYLDARRTYHSIQIQYFQALHDWNVERSALELAAGGGVL